jgi:hypothetical protein
MSPTTNTDSAEPQSRKSTPPSSPLAAQSPDDITKMLADFGKGQGSEDVVAEEEDGDEEMDHKSRALTNLLNTSSVTHSS